MNNDRREYFRITDTAYIKAAPFDPNKPSIPDYFPELHQIAVKKEFESVDAQVGEFLDRIKDASVKKLIGLMNEKLELMSRYLYIRDTHELKLEAQTIDVSEGGCSVWMPESYQPGDQLALALIFTPSYLAIFCQAHVTDIQPDNGGKRLHLEFVGLGENQRQALTRHMFKVQAQNR